MIVLGSCGLLQAVGEVRQLRTAVRLRRPWPGEAGVLEVVVPVDVVGWPGWVWLMLGGEVVGGDTDGLPLPMGSTSAMDTMMSLLMG